MSEQPSGEIYKLIPKIMQTVGAIGKGRRNTQQGYQFRGIDDVYNAMQGPLAEHGVFVVPSVTDRIREERPTRDGKGTLFYTTLTVRHTFYAPDGSSIEAVTVGEAMDSGDKSSNKAMSAAMKYALIEVFSIPTEGDNDTENHTPAPAAQQRPAAPARRETVNRGTGEASPKWDESVRFDTLSDQEKLAIQLKELLTAVPMPEGWLASCLKRAKVNAAEEMPVHQLKACINAVQAKQTKAVTK